MGHCVRLVSLLFPFVSLNVGHVQADVDDAQSHQNAVAKLLRKELVAADLQGNCPNAANLSPELAVEQGPAAYAWSLIRKYPFNQKQIELLALLILPLETAIQNRLERLDKTTYKLPNDLGLVRTLMVGGGGCGKTTLIMEVLKPLLSTYFGPSKVQLAAPSNKAARLIQGRTVHNLVGLRATDSLKSYALTVRRHADQRKLESTLGQAGA